MATISTLPVAGRRPQLFSRLSASDSAAVVGCAAIAFLLLGYHPYAEDGGIYAAAAALRLDPSLFPLERGFAVAHTSRSLFIPLIAGITHVLHLSLPVVLLLCYVATLTATMVSALNLARLLFDTRRAQMWSVVMLAVCMGLPVAGTSLYLADPYLTARSLSTPILLWSVILLMQRRHLAACGLLVVAFVFHPLMAAWTVLLFAAMLSRRTSRPVMWTLALAAASLIAMAALAWLAPAESAAVRAASLSRDYWFIDQWDWYEVVGMVAPLLILSAMALLRRPSEGIQHSTRDLAIAVASSAAIVTAGSMLLIHSSDSSFLLARVQPLRLLHSTYLIFILILGGVLSNVRIRGWRGLHWIVCIAAAGGLLFMQRQLYDNSSHMELPGQQPRNGYEQAFLWAFGNTPKDALFAMDADYTTHDGEDAQVFRAIAQRSALPDTAKDGGIASVMPNLAEAWRGAARAQLKLNAATDAERIARVKPLGATWLLLPAAAKTMLPCSYTNNVAKICRLP